MSIGAKIIHDHIGYNSAEEWLVVNGRKNMNYFITGSGSLASELTKQLLNKKNTNKIFVYSRGEKNQYEFHKKFNNNKRIIMIIGDIRDKDAISKSILYNNINVLLHTAAVKQIDVAEKYPEEAIKTNVIGTQNVVSAVREAKVKKALLISTDKAVSPISVYGGSKLMSESLWNKYNNKNINSILSVVRYGNVLYSNNSVLPYWTSQAKKGKDLMVTAQEMTRFFISIQEAAKFILNKIDIMEPGVKYIPHMKKFKMLDIAKKIAKRYGVGTYIGSTRCEEKLHEKLIADTEIDRTISCYNPDTDDSYYKILPVGSKKKALVKLDKSLFCSKID